MLQALLPFKLLVLARTPQLRRPSRVMAVTACRNMCCAVIHRSPRWSAVMSDMLLWGLRWVPCSALTVGQKGSDASLVLLYELSSRKRVSFGFLPYMCSTKSRRSPHSSLVETSHDSQTSLRDSASALSTTRDIRIREALVRNSRRLRFTS